MLSTQTECKRELLKRLKEEGIACPMDIVKYLNKHVIGQQKAKKDVSMMIWNHLYGIKTNTLFIGPSGCGKTHIWRVLSELPVLKNFIYITDASGITQKGWRGRQKSDSILMDAYYNDLMGSEELKPFLESSIFVFDEFDKLLAPQFSAGGDNVSYSLQSEFLTMIEGADIALQESGTDYSDMVDTRGMSFAFSGAFEEIYKKRHADEKSGAFGFGETQDGKDKPITSQDIIDYGCRPELAGRIHKISELSPLTKEQVMTLLRKPETSPISKYVSAYGITVSMTQRYVDDLAKKALASPLGIRFLESEVSESMSDILLYSQPEDYTGLTVVLDIDPKTKEKISSISQRQKKPRQNLESISLTLPMSEDRGF